MIPYVYWQSILSLLTCAFRSVQPPQKLSPEKHIVSSQKKFVIPPLKRVNKRRNRLGNWSFICEWIITFLTLRCKTTRPPETHHSVCQYANMRIFTVKFEKIVVKIDSEILRRVDKAATTWADGCIAHAMAIMYTFVYQNHGYFLWFWPRLGPTVCCSSLRSSMLEMRMLL